ncbi:helix-turn-helix domain-containing protein [Kitasatospora sp. NBC_00240]|uniref:helix-turn-helix domain-containing protein n=1 Tax=Kitasatospora sp. NBC_00240 TaxID=2903567 RepID=UPI0022550D3E|nr:helix-turn-helix domain-containing protein [Kitasatospora sp. NBC_00240]MCX5215690.1 helix-turn-helix domain-containing protein [Kitasatospora sp. NBC_00240]
MGSREATGFSAAALRTLRAEASLSQGDLALRARRSGSKLAAHHICLYEKGRRTPRLTTLKALAAGLGVPLSALVASCSQDDLKTLRTLAGLSQRRLAALLGIAQARWSRIERGLSSLDESKLHQAAGLLLTSTEELQRVLRAARPHAAPPLGG